MQILSNTYLVTEIGPKAALILSKLDYWIGINREKHVNLVNGRYWTFSSIKDIQERDFPCMSESTIKRHIKKLEEKNLISTGFHCRFRSKRDKWYTINYKVLRDYHRKFIDIARPEGVDDDDPLWASLQEFEMTFFSEIQYEIRNQG